MKTFWCHLWLLSLDNKAIAKRKTEHTGEAAVMSLRADDHHSTDSSAGWSRSHRPQPSASSRQPHDRKVLSLKTPPQKLLLILQHKSDFLFLCIRSTLYSYFCISIFTEPELKIDFGRVTGTTPRGDVGCSRLRLIWHFSRG